MEDRRQSVSITPFILSAICYQFGNLHKSMVLQNLHDLLDPSYYSNLQSEKHGLSQGFSTLALCIQSQIMLCWGRGCPVHCRMLSSFSGLYPIHASSTYFLPRPRHTHSGFISKNVSTLYQISQVTTGCHRKGVGEFVCTKSPPTENYCPKLRMCAVRYTFLRKHPDRLLQEGVVKTSTISLVK